MRIGFEARALSHPQPGGFKTYTTNLLRALLEVDTKNQYIMFLDRLGTAEFLEGKSNIWVETLQHLDGWLEVPWREQVSLRIALQSQRPNLVHFPCATGTIATPYPTVVTVHDVIEYIEPPTISRPIAEGTRRLLMKLYNRLVQYAVARRASVIITVSNHSKSDLVKYLQIPEYKFRVIPEAPGQCYSLIEDKGKIRDLRIQYDLPRQFILALVSASPRKNVDGLLCIYARLPIEMRRAYPLVLVWTHSLLQTRIDALLRRLDLANYVRSLTQVSEEELALLYNAASLFVFPSLYEGFGLPVLEAMACGTPVVASNLTSIPEVAGNAAELADPKDEHGFARAMVDVLSSSIRQMDLSQAGLRHVRDFSWQQVAKKTLEIYEEVGGG